MAITRRASGITKEGLNPQGARGTVDFERAAVVLGGYMECWRAPTLTPQRRSPREWLRAGVTPQMELV